MAQFQTPLNHATLPLVMHSLSSIPHRFDKIHGFKKFNANLTLFDVSEISDILANITRLAPPCANLTRDTVTFPRATFQIQLYTNSEKAESLLLVFCAP